MDEAGDSTFPNWPEFRRLFAYDNLIGKVLQGRYEIVRRLGAGGMGVVFLARHIHLDKAFALKIISPRFLDEPEIGQRFLLEARAASKIDHPNVVSITDFGPPEEGPAFFVMEHLEGEDLARLLAREGPLPWPRALPIVAQIARALAAAHQRGVVHRDIKPQNCFRVTRDGRPDFIKVLDFGLAKVLSGTGQSAWTVGGSPGYIAPEIFRGGRTDHRVDIFALGVVMHTLLLGRLPAQDPADVPGAPVVRAEDLPAPLRAIVARATHEDPAQRYASAEALLAALDAAGAAILRDVPKTRSKVTAAASRRRGPLLAAALGGLAVTLALARGGSDAGTDAARSATHSDGAPGSSTVAPSTAPAAVTAVRTGPTAAATDPDPSPTASPRPGATDSSPVATDRSTAPPGRSPADGSPVATDSPPAPSGAPVATDRSPEARAGGPGGGARPRRPPPAFDPVAARALLQRSAPAISACKAGSSFGGVATTVRLSGRVQVSARGRASVELPSGYDVNACIAAVVAGLQFRASVAGGSFDHVFLL